ncbi:MULTISPECIES: hydroxyacid dehydrogenase [unclassified Streptomyces]|uniref:hydroxyacid dehydrogenase n=1 Tax=unclassified Streptomyces TaxID=2593676 RepID=UPI00093A337E|nr:MULTISPECIES: hydroxyacid dehydrogenase [unclassified Streptomyces]OKI46338.1 hydroxyacid dehydrogenase [Streptomyces sp. TSRI0281]WRZ76327.1 hydroxyacid dehydrogenase [Streptomyces sp. NBC_01237]
MSPGLLDDVFPPPVRARLEETADLHNPAVISEFDSAQAAEALAGAEVLLTGWGCPPVDAALLDRAPRLRAVIHAAGTVKTFLSPDAFDRGIAVSSAAAANAVPVAEYTLAAIIMGAKRVFPLAELFRTRRTHRTGADLDRQHWLGTHGLTIGVVGASRIGRRVIELLRVLDADVLLYDPYVGPAEAELLGVTPADLDTLVATSDVVTVHAPDTPETRGLIDARRIGLMRPGTLLVNTARGPLVDTEALTGHLVSGRLDAVLDVTFPEPLPPGHPLWDLPNVFITPHLAGAQGNEVGRLGALAVDELARYAAGSPFAHPVHRADLGRIA